MSKILLAGNDFRLLATRAAVLAKTNAAVVCCNAREAMQVLESETFNLVVLCHSLEEQQATEITEVVHQRMPLTRILMIVSDVLHDRFYKGVEFDAISSPDPDHLIRSTSELLAALPNHHIEESMPAVRPQTRPLVEFE